MFIKSVLAACVVAIGIAAPASALTITSIDGDWLNATPSVTGEGTDSIRWGTDAGYGQSGYDFDAAPTDLYAAPDVGFSLGTFTHLNFPIRDTVLDTVDLALSFTIQGLTSTITSVFSFDHLETPNHLNSKWQPLAATCADGNANGSGVNSNGCADRVTATTNLGSSQTFTIGATTYILDVMGFMQNGTLLTDFWTIERQTNSAELWAVFRTISTETPEVPLPASGLLLLGGLGALAARRRFR